MENVRTSVYSVRDALTKERLTYCYRTLNDAIEALLLFRQTDRCSRSLEIYRTTQVLPRKNP